MNEEQSQFINLNSAASSTASSGQYEQYNQRTPPQSNPQLSEQLAAELIETRRQLAAVQQQLLSERAAYQQRNAEDEQIAAQRYSQMAQSVEQFLDGRATVGDVVKTVSANIAHDENLWKGAMVGAAAAVLLTSKPVREAMGKTVDGVFGGGTSGGS